MSICGELIQTVISMKKFSINNRYQSIASLMDCFLLAIIIFFVLVQAMLFVQVDFWWQLAEGNYILSHGRIPSAPIMGVGGLYQPFFNEYILYEVIIALIWKLGGFEGTWLFFYLLSVGTFLLPLSNRRRHLGPFLAVMFFLAALLLLPRIIQQRPESVGTFLACLLGVLLVRTSEPVLTWRRSIAVIAIFWVWSNLHSSFIIGYFMLSLWVFERAINRYIDLRRAWPVVKSSAILVWVLVAAAINPYGALRFAFPFWQQADIGTLILSPELWAPKRGESYFMLACSMLGGWFWFRATRGRCHYWIVVFLVTSLVLGTVSYRYVNFVGISLLIIYALTQEIGFRDSSYGKGRHILLRIVLSLSLILFFMIVVFMRLEKVSQFYVMNPKFGIADSVYLGRIGDIHRDNWSRPSLVLCDSGIGSYLSYYSEYEIYPVLDSGLGRYNKDVKRFIYLAAYSPAALRCAAGNLGADKAVATDPAWVGVFSALSEWHPISFPKKSVVYARGRLDKGLEIDFLGKVERQVDHLINEFHDYEMAFSVSLLLKDKRRSFEILRKSDEEIWGEPFANFFVEWLKECPEEYLVDVVNSNEGSMPLRLHCLYQLRRYEELVDLRKEMPLGNSWANCYFALSYLALGRNSEAIKVFTEISPRPKASLLEEAVLKQLLATGDPGISKLRKPQKWAAYEPEDDAFIERIANDCHRNYLRRQQKQDAR